MNTNKKFRLFTAGPVSVSPEVLNEICQPLLYHRDAEFLSIFREVIAGIQFVLQTKNDICLLTASGTGGMDAIVVNLFSPGDHVLVVEQGKFSARWSEICKAYGLKIKSFLLPWGNSVEGDQIKNILQLEPDIKAVLLTHCETSTGAINDIAAISREIRDISDVLIIVDAISTIGAVPFKMDEWKIDVTVFSSNKGLKTPPGAAFIALNDKAWAFVKTANLPKYYFDFKKYQRAIQNGIGTPFTPPVSLIRGIHKAILSIKKLGLQKFWENHRKMALAFRSAIQSMGLEIFPANPSDSITVIKIPSELNVDLIKFLLKEKYQMIVSGGQGQLKDNVIRIGHLGEMTHTDLKDFLLALEQILIELGWNITAGNGIKVYDRNSL